MALPASEGGSTSIFARKPGVRTAVTLYDVLIEVRNRGLRHGPEEVMRHLTGGENVDPVKTIAHTVS